MPRGCFAQCEAHYKSPFIIILLLWPFVRTVCTYYRTEHMKHLVCKRNSIWKKKILHCTTYSIRIVNCVSLNVNLLVTNKGFIFLIFFSLYIYMILQMHIHWKEKICSCRKKKTKQTFWKQMRLYLVSTNANVLSLSFMWPYKSITYSKLYPCMLFCLLF